jgi:hypothetical protein
VNLEEKHGRDVDGLEHDELDRVNGGHREGRRLLVGVVQLVEVLVQERPVEHTVAPVCKIILLKEKDSFVSLFHYLSSIYSAAIIVPEWCLCWPTISGGISVRAPYLNSNIKSFDSCFL